MAELLGDLYLIDVQDMSSNDLGWADKRCRHIRNLQHKKKVAHELQPWGVIASMFSRICRFSWDEYFMLPANHEELLHELNKLVQREGVSRRGDGDDDDLSAFEKALTDVEYGRYLVYKEKWPNCCYMLNQDVHTHPQRSSEHLLPTIIRNVGILFSPMHKRWLTARELLCVQGFPALNHLLAAATTGDTSFSLDEARPGTKLSPVCSFNVANATRQRSSMAGQAGDSMSVNMIGAAIVHLIAFVVRLDTEFRNS